MTQQEALDPNTTPARLWELAVKQQDAALVDLFLVSVPSHKKIAVIKALKDLSRASLYTSKKWTDDVPCFINRRGVALNIAALIQREVNATGAVLQLQPKVTPTELAIYIAQNSVVLIDLLWALGISEDCDLRSTVAQHPLLPEPLLYFLGAELPGLFLQNPVIQLAMLEDPEVFFRWPEPVRAALLTLPDVSEGLLLRVIIGGPSTLRKIALTHPKISAAFIQDLAARPDLDQDLHAELAAHPTTSAEVLSLMSHSNYETILGVLAMNPNTPPAVLHTLSTSRGTVRNRLAQNPSTPPELLWALATQGGEEVIFSFKKNRTLSADFLRELARHPSQSARQTAASHTNTSPEMLNELSRDESQEVVFAVAQNPSASAQTLEQLIARRHPIIAEGVAQNPSAPGTLLQQIIEQTKHDGWHPIIALLAQNPALPEEVCQQYLASMNLGTLRILAANTKHTKILEELSRKAERELRVAVAQNPSTPPEILATLLQDTEDAVRQQALARYRSVEWM